MQSKLMSCYQDELSFALDMAEQTGQIAMRYFNKGIEIVTKDDGSPVTKADKEVERFIREAIAQKYPDDGILGEEEGEVRRSNRTWIVDPIDGTYNYARGIPIWSTLIALEVDKDVVLGIVNAPAMHECFYAERDCGAFKNGEQIKVSQVDRLDHAMFNFGGPNRILNMGYWPALTECTRLTERQRGFGDYLGFSLVFEGRSEAILEVGVNPWDLASMKIIAEEAGGCYMDLAGGSSIYTGSCLITNRHLKADFERLFIVNR